MPPRELLATLTDGPPTEGDLRMLTPERWIPPATSVSTTRWDTAVGSAARRREAEAWGWLEHIPVGTFA